MRYNDITEPLKVFSKLLNEEIYFTPHERYKPKDKKICYTESELKILVSNKVQGNELILIHEAKTLFKGMIF